MFAFSYLIALLSAYSISAYSNQPLRVRNNLFSTRLEAVSFRYAYATKELRISITHLKIDS